MHNHNTELSQTNGIVLVYNILCLVYIPGRAFSVFRGCMID